MTNAPLWLKALIVVACLAGLVFLYARCATVKRIVAECGPVLAARAADILTHETWREEMRATAAEVGVSTMACAVRVLLQSLSQPEDGPDAQGLVAVVGKPGDLRRAVVHKRASLWLTEARVP
jgi:hypothetical protein